ncbi:hypothetical protein Tco_1424931 [Tanacetum coccineum]
MDSSMCSSAPDPEMWIIQVTLAWRTPPVRTGIISQRLPSVGRRGNRHHLESAVQGELYAAVREGMEVYWFKSRLASCAGEKIEEGAYGLTSCMLPWPRGDIAHDG